MKKITEFDLSKMSSKERFELRRSCAKNRDIESLLTIVKFHFIKGSKATNETNLPEMFYYYGRLDRIESLHEYLSDKTFYFNLLSDSCRELAFNLMKIGHKFPFLVESEIDYLEDKYCDPKTFELFDIIMFDKELLPRPIKKLEREFTSEKSEGFSKVFLLEVYNCFSENKKLMSNNEKLFIYSIWQNKIIKKEYSEIGTGEYVITQPIRSSELWDLLNKKLGEYFADSIVKNLCYHDNWEQFKNLSWFNLDPNLIEESLLYFVNDKDKSDAIKTDISQFWLNKVNSLNK